MKKEAQEAVMWAIRRDLGKKQIRGTAVDLEYIYYEVDRRRDHDNVSGFAHKIIQAALVDTDVLNGDGWKEIRDTTDRFRVDKKHPRIEVIIREVDEDG